MCTNIRTNGPKVIEKLKGAVLKDPVYLLVKATKFPYSPFLLRYSNHRVVLIGATYYGPCWPQIMIWSSNPTAYKTIWMRNDGDRVGVPISGESAVWAEEENYTQRCFGNVVCSWSVKWITINPPISVRTTNSHHQDIRKGSGIESVHVAWPPAVAYSHSADISRGCKNSRLDLDFPYCVHTEQKESWSLSPCKSY
jgi:hypothetical protein